MQPEIERARTHMLQILIIATTMTGFGLFNTSFVTEVAKLLQDDPAFGFNLSPLGVYPPSFIERIALVALLIPGSILGLLIAAHYIAMLGEARILFLKTNLSDRDLAEWAASPFRRLRLMAVLTITLFIARQTLIFYLPA